MKTLVELLRELDLEGDEATRAGIEFVVAGAQEIASGAEGTTRPATARIRWQQAISRRLQLSKELHARLVAVERQQAAQQVSV